LNGRSADRSIGRSDDRSVRSLMGIVSSNVKGRFSDPRAAADTIIDELVSVFSSISLTVLARCRYWRAQLIDCVSIRLWALACHSFFNCKRDRLTSQLSIGCSTTDQLGTVVALGGFGRAKRSASRHPHSMDRIRPVQRSS
jgi:hypothetical protein